MTEKEYIAKTLIQENEVDPSWKQSLSDEYLQYRHNFETLRTTKPLDVPPFPFSIEIEATYYCNLSCPFCPRGVNAGEREIKHLDPKLWELILSEAKKFKLPSLLIAHEGEALMNPKLASMVKEAREAGILDVWVHSNGQLMSEKRAEELIDAGLTRINFSIDAAHPETHKKLRVGADFERVHRNIHKFIELKKQKNADYLRVRVSFVAQAENIREKDEFVAFWQEKVNMVTFQDCIDFTPFEKPDADAKLSPEALEAKYAHEKSEAKFTCAEPWTMPIIDVEGNVIPCGKPVREHNKDFYLGNLKKGDTIHGCWTGEKMRKLRELHLKGEFYKNDMCRVCVNTCRKSQAELREMEKRLATVQ